MKFKSVDVQNYVYIIRDIFINSERNLTVITNLEAQKLFYPKCKTFQVCN